MSLITTYNPLPVQLTHGKGVWLFDESGKKYLDTFSGIAVCGLGHAHPEVAKTIAHQASKLLHISNAFPIQEQIALAERLSVLTGMQQAFFANSGAEANESAIKLARLYGHKKGLQVPMIVVMDRSFHGRTMATLTASGNPKIKDGFEPLLPGFVHVPFNDIEALKKLAATRDDIAAVMLEPIQGEGGVIPAKDGYLEAIRALCNEKEWLLILDEVQTGNGRTGSWFMYQQLGIMPDIVTTAKGLGNGMPVSVCLMHGPACDLFKPGNHGSTFGGNPLAMATALTVLDVIERDNLCARAHELGLYIQDKLRASLADLPGVQAVRGRGLMLGIALDRPANEVKLLGLSHGLLLNVTAESVIRLLPALIMTDDEVEEMLVRLKQVLTQFLNG